MTTLLSLAPTSMRLMVNATSPWIGTIHILSLWSPCHHQATKGTPTRHEPCSVWIKHPVKRTRSRSGCHDKGPSYESPPLPHARRRHDRKPRLVKRLEPDLSDAAGSHDRDVRARRPD